MKMLWNLKNRKLGFITFKQNEDVTKKEGARITMDIKEYINAIHNRLPSSIIFQNSHLITNCRH